MRRYSHILFLIVMMLSFSPHAIASHIVGGEVFYKCLGNNLYQVTVNIYEDCETGEPGAIADDDPAKIAIYDGNRALIIADVVSMSPRITVPANFSNDCVKDPPRICLYKASFVKNYSLPANVSGYTIVYQRCCRNNTVLNINNPGSTGATFSTTIPGSGLAVCNSSPVFNNYPPQIICINNPLVYDHSAVDPDGDSLSYELCTAYGGGTNNDAKPDPAAPPFQPVSYVSPFSAANPMGGFPQIKINPKTGLLTGTPNLRGRFVVTVCCSEWRNGRKINTVSRDFQFVVTPCSRAVVADMPQFSDEFNTYIVNCEDHTVKFFNTSTGDFSWYWDFGVPGATSNDREPIYTYPDSGTYTVKLVVNKGTTCPDSITRIVKVYPTLHSDFNFSGLYCPGLPIAFTDLTESTYKPINSWYWDFGDGNSSTDQSTLHTYFSGGTYNVRLITSNVKGCIDTARKDVYIEIFKPFVGNDTVIVKGESIYFNATGGIHYIWTPATNLSNPNINSPVGYYPDTGMFAYNVYIKSEAGCEANDSIYVRVVNAPTRFVPSAFSPNGDGKNDMLKPIAVGYRSNNYFKVFNRFGQVVFYSTDFSEGWDGRFKGQDAELGVYFWELSLTDRFGKKEFYKGDVTLLR